MEIRKKEPTVLPHADSSYDDWRGTAIAETSFIKGSGDLYKLAGLDGEREKWTILGMEMSAYSHGAEPTWHVRVYAADREELGVESFEDWGRVAATHGGIPVVDVLLHDLSINDIMKCMKLFGVQLRSGHIKYDLLHSAYADHPEQN